MSPHRYPLEPLARALGIQLHVVGGYQEGGCCDVGLVALGAAIGITDARYLRRLAQHGLTERLADRSAVRAGFHPALVWPDWWDHAIGEDDEWYGDDPGIDELDRECLRMIGAA